MWLELLGLRFNLAGSIAFFEIHNELILVGNCHYTHL